MHKNKYSLLNENNLLKYKEEQETEKIIRISKKKFEKQNPSNDELVVKLNSELSMRREYNRHIDAALIDSEKLNVAEKDINSVKQMEEHRKLGLFGDYPEINSALNRNSDTLLRIENLRKNEVIPDNFI